MEEMEKDRKRKSTQLPRRHRRQYAGPRVRRTYRQHWRLYDMGQVHEQEHFERLLRELCDTIPQPEHQMGRPRLLLGDMVVVICMKVYSQLSGRRAMTCVRRAHASGQLTRVPSPTTMARYLRQPGLTPLLETLIEMSAVPLGMVEDVFAVDSTDFQLSPVSAQRRWKYRQRTPGQKQLSCPKAHVMAGVHTHIVVAARATPGESSDAKYLPELVAATARHFRISEVSADGAYSTKANHWAVHEVGGTFYCPFKTTANPRDPEDEKDSLWEQAYLFHLWHRDEFRRHYNRRQNVESVMGMVKARFSPIVRSRSDVARANEVLAKLLCHNLCVLVQSMYKLRIVPAFPPGVDRLSLN